MHWFFAVLLTSAYSTPLFAGKPAVSTKVIVELRDRSRLVGMSPTLEFAFVKDDGKKMKLSTAQLCEVVADKDREICTLSLPGQQLRGVVRLKELKVRGVFGNVTVPFDEIARIQFHRPTLGLIAHYKFEGNCNDASGNGNDGKRHDNVSFVKGRDGKAASFDGWNDYIAISPKSNVKQIRDFTVSAWVMTRPWNPPRGFSRTQHTHYIFDCYSEPATRKFNSSGFSIMCAWRKGKDCVEGYTSAGPKGHRMLRHHSKVFGQWRLVTFIRHGDRESIYVDGVPTSARTVSQAGNTNRVLNLQHTWYIGTYGANDPNYPGLKRGFRYDFHGRIDDLRIYNRALNELEIRELAGRIPHFVHHAPTR